MMTRLLAAAALCALPATAHAAVTYKVQNGKLIGASGVVANGKTYDLAIVDGTCAAVFNGCTGNTSFAFANADEAADAGRALIDTVLLDNVMVDGKQYNFGGSGDNVNGVGERGGDFLIAFGVSPATRQTKVMGVRSGANGSSLLGTFYTKWSDDTAKDEYTAWAKFTLAGASADPVAAVPEPATWTLMLAGFGLTGAAMRRRRRAVTVTGSLA